GARLLRGVHALAEYAERRRAALDLGDHRHATFAALEVEHPGERVPRGSAFFDHYRAFLSRPRRHARPTSRGRQELQPRRTRASFLRISSPLRNDKFEEVAHAGAASAVPSR